MGTGRIGQLGQLVAYPVEEETKQGQGNATTHHQPTEAPIALGQTPQPKTVALKVALLVSMSL